MRTSSYPFQDHGRVVALTIVACCLLLGLPALADADAPGPLWAPLTPFESSTLRNVSKARAGDADTLLALALMASGDVRHRAGYEAIRQRVRRFVDALGPEMGRQPSIYAKGETLLSAMHRHFFPKSPAGGDSDLVAGYDAQQSKVSTIFQNGRFNCISSAIFYSVLARYFDLEVNGVLTAHHAFIQISGQNGRRIDVETTSRHGYGLVHDKAFFESGLSAFSRERDLAMPTYEDYLKRRIVPPVLLIAQNMNNQHTAPAHMHPAARDRLLELQGYLDPGGAPSQLSRLNALHNAMAALLNAGNYSRAMALADVLEPVLGHVAASPWIHRIQDEAVGSIWAHMSAIHTMWGHVLFKQARHRQAEGRFTEALSWAKTTALKTEARKGLYRSSGQRAFNSHRWKQAIDAYEKLRSLTDPSDRQQLRHARETMAAAYFNWGNAAGEQSRWLDAARRYDAVEKNSQNRAVLQKARSARAFVYARHHLEKRRWAKAIEYFEIARSIQSPVQQAVTNHNIGSTYLLWANALFENKQYRLAVEKYAAALHKVEGHQQSAIYNNIGAAYRRLAEDLIKAGKRAQAGTLWESAARRFPDCIPCQEGAARYSRKSGAFWRP